MYLWQSELFWTLYIPLKFIRQVVDQRLQKMQEKKKNDINKDYSTFFIRKRVLFLSFAYIHSICFSFFSSSILILRLFSSRASVESCLIIFTRGIFPNTVQRSTKIHGDNERIVADCWSLRKALIYDSLSQSLCVYICNNTCLDTDCRLRSNSLRSCVLDPREVGCCCWFRGSMRATIRQVARLRLILIGRCCRRC